MASSLLAPRAMSYAHSWVRAGVLILAAVLPLWAGTLDNDRFCASCGAVFASFRYRALDLVEKKDVWVCDVCSRANEQCEVCNTPLSEKGRLKIADGRLYCHRDYRTLVLEQREAEGLFKDVRREVSRMLNHWGDVHDDGIVFTLVDKDEFLRQYRSSPTIHNPESVHGLTRSKQVDNAKFQHDIFVLNGLRREQFLAVAAHEYTHAWLAERQLMARTLHDDTVEGFCELVAWKLMSDHRDTLEQERIDENAYTRGQISALRSAEASHRFYRVVDWVLGGVDSWLEREKIERVLVLRDDVRSAETQAIQPTSTSYPTPPLVAAPDRLILRGVLGTERSGRTALINDGLFRHNESGRVRIGSSNVVLRCLEIRMNSVVVQVEGATAKQELSLATK